MFSGDLVFAGGTENLYSAFATNIAEGLNRHFSRDRIICVPGNHDISQEALRPFATLQLGALDALTSEALFNDHVPQLSDILFRPKLSDYVAAEAAFAKYGCCQTTLGGTGWDLANGIGVYCLNTALCSYAHLPDSQGAAISDKNKLMIDTRAMQQWLLQTTSTIRILVMHHPIEWLTPWATSELDKIIANDFLLVFSGHLHQATARFSSRGGFYTDEDTYGVVLDKLGDNGVEDARAGLKLLGHPAGESDRPVWSATYDRAVIEIAWEQLQHERTDDEVTEYIPVDSADVRSWLFRTIYWVRLNWWGWKLRWSLTGRERHRWDEWRREWRPWP